MGGFRRWGLLAGLVGWSGCVGSAVVPAQEAAPGEPTIEAAVVPPPAPEPKVSTARREELHSYARQHGYSTTFGLFADLGRFSGKKRFHVVELDSGRVLHSGLVAHGHCREDAPGVRFSDTPGSNCSSEGKYRVGASYTGQFGLAYKLEGLESTNSNAFERFIVMHAHSCVTDTVSEYPICESEGCPTLSPELLQRVSALVDAESSPVLLWIYP
jgi:hypothetical protein